MGDILFSVDRSFCKDRCLESGVCYKTTADYVEVEVSSGSCAMWRFFAGWMLLGLVVAFFEILWIIWIMRRRRAAARRAIVDGEVAVAQAEAVVEEMDVEEQPVVEDVVVAERRPTMELPVFRILGEVGFLAEWIPGIENQCKCVASAVMSSWEERAFNSLQVLLLHIALHVY
ncbi:hypothetical protein Q1695_014918 [Nippostrongylus brasiliensis]|nr:hypothetical protein Q1695_014918 [Nippostrongylus brasiliensis]